MKNKTTDKITYQMIDNKVNLEDPFPYVTDKTPLEKAEIIYRTAWKSYPIYIKSVMGLYPTAYIDTKCSYIIEHYDTAAFKVAHKKFEKNAPFEITYADKHLAISNKMGCQGDTLKGNFIGWDYAHCDDYNALMPDWYGHHYTIAEIVKDATDFIDNNLIPTMEEIHDERNSNRDANIQIKRKVMVNDNGFNRQVESWVDLEEAQVNTTKFGGNTLFIGDL